MTFRYEYVAFVIQAFQIYLFSSPTPFPSCYPTPFHIIMRTGWLANGTYVRMKDNNREQAFNNGMRLTFDSTRYGKKALLEYQWWNIQEGMWIEQWCQQEVDVEYLNDFACRVDWELAKPKWGQKEFSVVFGTLQPFKGLLEDNSHYWQRESQ